MGGILKLAAEIVSGVMIYVPCHIKSGSVIQKLMGDMQTHRQHADRISLLSFFQKIRKVG
jgi:hypothetical protein